MADNPQIDGTNSPDLEAVTNSLVTKLQKGFGADGSPGWLIDAIGKASMGILGALVAGTKEVSVAVAKGLQVLMEGADEVAGPIAATVLSIMFGGDIGGVFATATGEGGSPREVAPAVGAAVLEAVFGPLQLDGGAALEPGVDRAEAYLGTIASMVMRGFLLDIAEESLPHWHLEVVKNLEEELISGLGLGRVARRVLSPIVTTLVADPAQWAINLAYRPKLLDVGAAILQWRRNRMSDAQLDDELGRQGWSSDRIEALKTLNTKTLSVDDLLFLMEDNTLSESDAADVLVSEGYDPDDARTLLHVRRQQQIRSLYMRAANVWIDKYASGFIDRDVLVGSLTSLALPADTLEALMVVAGAYRETPSKRLSESEIITAWKKNIISQNDAIDAMMQMGYSGDDAQTRVLVELATVRDKDEADQAKKAAKDATAAAAAAKKQADAADKAAAKAAAAADRAAKLQAAKDQKAKIAADQQALRKFAAESAAQKKALVDQQHAAAQIDADAAAAARVQIDADHVALLAAITAQEKNADVEFRRQILDLQQANREATIQEQLDDVDLAREADARLRTDGVTARLEDVDTILGDKLAELDTIYTARAQAIDDDLAAAIGSVEASVMPTVQERQDAAAAQIASLDAALKRKLADSAAEYVGRHAAVDEQVDHGDLKGPAADKAHIALQTSEADAKRLLQQQHDLGVDRAREVSTLADAVAVDKAAADKIKLAQNAESARRKLATDKLTAMLQAQQAADADRVRLTTIGQQIGPITDAEAARRRASIQTAANAAKRQEAVTAAEIAKGEADAHAEIAKANAGVDAAKARLVAVRAAAGTREAATHNALQEQAALAARLTQEQAQLQAQLDADQLAALTA